MRKITLRVIALSVLLMAVTSVAYPGARVRLQVVGLKLMGKLPGISKRDLYPLLRPNQGFDLGALQRTRDPLSTLKLPARFEADTAIGTRIFETRCSQCHGLQGEGGLGPSLAEDTRRHGATDWATFRVMRDGVPGTAMAPTGLSFSDTWRVIARLHDLQRERGEVAGKGPSPRQSVAPVSEAELASADSSGVDWLTYSGGWSGQRNKDLPELTTASIKRLRLAWAFQLPSDPAWSQSTPLAARGLLLVTTGHQVIALDQANGAVVWRFHRETPAGIKICCAPAIRGVGLLGNLVFVGTLDAHLLALDLSTGGVAWDVEVAPIADGFSITSAPLVIDGRVLIGVAGGEFGVRGFLDAYDAASGRRLWRFNTIPGPGEPGRESWPEHATPGGGTTWVPGSFDPVRHLLYWGTGNPSPALAADVRSGDNLYTNSVIALDIRTGALKWFYQFMPHDSHDWDAAQTPVLVDARWGGRQRPLLLWANRNGFFYVLDRETGEFLRATPFARQNWNDGFDTAGRPKTKASAQPTPGGTIVYPGLEGATSWWPPTYSRRLGLMFVAIREDGSVFFRHPNLYSADGTFLGGRAQPVPGEPPANSVVAIDFASGAVRWKTSTSGSGIATMANTRMGGLVSIADRLVLGGQGDMFFALDARTGRRLWETHLGASIQGAPMVFRTNRVPRIGLAAGSVLFVFELGSS
jgi:alcohol dehydrogenase (cytochrome c)